MIGEGDLAPRRCQEVIEFRVEEKLALLFYQSHRRCRSIGTTADLPAPPRLDLPLGTAPRTLAAAGPFALGNELEALLLVEPDRPVGCCPGTNQGRGTRSGQREP